ncbi:MAG: Rpn family recombination-promoting nuclease/putative transposase [Schleiferiaceae bacterium]|nr:Rpn family recombination-promoting nuclease/putative transposase [Schleiferiaceae bacterium]
MAKKLVRFDWAIKKLLRHKANFSILEGFLSELLKFDVTIVDVLEGEGNQENALDKYNRVDVLVKSAEGELMLVEVQNESQVDYFQRMIYGVSKLISEYIQQGEPYSQVKKVFSINIVYFELGQGSDYVYEYNGQFVGIHNGDVLKPNGSQRAAFGIAQVKDLFPQYYVLKVNNFNDVAKDSLDEWIYFLKNSEIQDNFQARGLQEAAEKLKEDTLSPEEQRAYRQYQENRRIERSEIETALQEGEEKGIQKVALNALRQGQSDAVIRELTGLSQAQLDALKKTLQG